MKYLIMNLTCFTKNGNKTMYVHKIIVITCRISASSLDFVFLIK